MVRYRFEATFEAEGDTAGNTPEALLDWLRQMVRHRIELAESPSQRLAWEMLLGILLTGKLGRVELGG